MAHVALLLLFRQDEAIITQQEVAVATGYVGDMPDSDSARRDAKAWRPPPAAAFAGDELITYRLDAMPTAHTSMFHRLRAAGADDAASFMTAHAYRACAMSLMIPSSIYIAVIAFKALRCLALAGLTPVALATGACRLFTCFHNALMTLRRASLSAAEKTYMKRFHAFVFQAASRLLAAFTFYLWPKVRSWLCLIGFI